MRYDALALFVLFVLVLWWINRRGRARIKAERGGMFNDCLPLFQSYRVTQDAVYFPVLTGRYRDHEVRLEPIADHIAIRKIPSLWLLATVRGEVPFGGTLDFLVRPQNIEFYSPSSELETRLSIPESWPQHAWLRTDRREALPPLELLTPHMGFFDDPKAKELLITPRGVRLVYQANQSVRAHYMVLRQVHFEDPKLSPDLVRDLLDRAIALYEDLTKEGQGIGEKTKAARET